MDKIDLYYKDGKSDKVYHAQIEAEGDGYIVKFQYGRRGSSLASGVKTKDPVSLEKAQAVLTSLYKEKTGKGYTEGAEGAIFQTQTLEERFTGNVPQLLNILSKDDKKKEELLVKLLADDDWIMQEKHDGHRTMIKKEGANIYGSNKKGLKIALPQSVVDKFTVLEGDVLFDGELIGETYYIFDILELGSINLRTEAVESRLQTLNSISQVNSMITPTFYDEKSKKERLEQLRVAKKEGVVFKKKGSAYVPGRPASLGNQLKYKFMEESTMIVVSHNETKRSIGVGVFNDETGELINLGNVTIYANQDIPPIGSIVEIRYMHCFEGGSIYVSTFKCLRDDQDKSDCLLSQIKFKPKDEEDDDN